MLEHEDLEAALAPYGFVHICEFFHIFKKNSIMEIMWIEGLVSIREASDTEPIIFRPKTIPEIIAEVEAAGITLP